MDTKAHASDEFLRYLYRIKAKYANIIKLR